MTSDGHRVGFLELEFVENNCSMTGLYDLPKRHGKLKELKKFDAQFFSVTPKQANYMDPQVRILLEVSFEAMIDAGRRRES